MTLRSLILIALPVALGAQTKDLPQFYKFACASCHGQNGSGRSWTGARLEGRVLNDPRWQARETDDELVKSILKGKRSMPSFKSQLTEAEARRMVVEVVRPMAARKK